MELKFLKLEKGDPRKAFANNLDINNKFKMTIFLSNLVYLFWKMKSLLHTIMANKK